MTMTEIVTIASLGVSVLNVGAMVSLYIHLSSTINARFDSVERRLELLQGAVHDLDLRLTKLER